MVIWTSIVDQWFTGASVTNEIRLVWDELMRAANGILTSGIVIPFMVLVQDNQSKNTDDSQARTL